VENIQNFGEFYPFDEPSGLKQEPFIKRNTMNESK